MTIDEQFEKLENTVREYNPGADFKRIRESYEFAKQHHGEQRRKSGELYHPPLSRGADRGGGTASGLRVH